MSNTSLSPNPDRIISMDVLRGVAVLGILIMNIQSFSMISAAYINPNAYGDLIGVNKTVWIVSHVLADQKFLSIFSMLFGAGIILFSENVEKKGLIPGRFYFRRLFWLFIIGMIHAYVFWHGDILVAYAVCGALAYLFRRLSPWVLLAIGLIVFFVPSFNYWLFGRSMEMWPPEAVSSLSNTWAPDSDAIGNEISALRGGILEQLSWRIPEAFKMQTFVFLISYGWRAFAMMRIGMSFLKLGILSGRLNKKTYLVLATITLPPGVFLILNGVDKNFAAGWTVEYSMFFGWQWNYIGSLFVAIAYVAIVMFLSKVIKLNLLAKVGKLAFTNYLLMTLICTTLFYGHGFGWFGSVERKEQLTIVLSIWAVLLLFSNYWLLWYNFGPLEWLWRYLTYGKKPIYKK
jgi:uncharacterized protein